MEMTPKLAYFLIYAFMGWVLEVVYHQLKVGRFVNRGMLAGPYCPIYGFGMSLLIATLEPLEDRFFLLALASAILCSLLELVGGFILDKLFHERWWDYTDEPMNIGGYICLRFSIAWGLGGALAVREIHPSVESLVAWMPDTLLMWIVGLSLVGMLIDTTITVSQIRGMNREVERLVHIQENMRKISDDVGKHIAGSVAKAGEVIHEIADQPELKAHLEEAHFKLTRRQRRLLRAYPNLRGTRSELQNEILQWLREKSRGNRLS